MASYYNPARNNFTPQSSQYSNTPSNILLLTPSSNSPSNSPSNVSSNVSNNSSNNVSSNSSNVSSNSSSNVSSNTSNNTSSFNTPNTIYPKNKPSNSVLCCLSICLFFFLGGGLALTFTPSRMEGGKKNLFDIGE